MSNNFAENLPLQVCRKICQEISTALKWINSLFYEMPTYET